MFQKYFFKVVTRLEFVGQEPFKILLLSEKQLGLKYLGCPSQKYFDQSSETECTKRNHRWKNNYDWSVKCM